MPTPLPSRLDANQVLQGAYDEDTGRLRTDAEATIVNADIDVSLDAADDSVESWVVDEAGNPFTDANYIPTGQSTHDNLNANANIQVNNIDVSNANPVPISAVSLPLPTGAATSALQTTGNSSLSSVDTKLTNLSNYIFHDLDDTSGTIYIGTLVSNNKYLIKKLVETGPDISILYANVSNNPGSTTYASAWSSRLTLNYNFIYNLTGI